MNMFNFSSIRSCEGSRQAQKISLLLKYVMATSDVRGQNLENLKVTFEKLKAKFQKGKKQWQFLTVFVNNCNYLFHLKFVLESHAHLFFFFFKLCNRVYGLVFYFNFKELVNCATNMMFFVSCCCKTAVAIIVF